MYTYNVEWVGPRTTGDHAAKWLLVGHDPGMESFFALLQKDVLYTRRSATRDELRIAIVTRIERTVTDGYRLRFRADMRCHGLDSPTVWPVADGSEEKAAATSGWAPALTVFIMGTAALLSVWAGFQSAKWGSEETITRAQATAERAFAETTFAAGESVADIEGEHFLDWPDADSQGDTDRVCIASHGRVRL